MSNSFLFPEKYSASWTFSVSKCLLKPGTHSAFSSLPNLRNWVSSILRSTNSSRQIPSSVAAASSGPKGVRILVVAMICRCRAFARGEAGRFLELVREPAQRFVPGVESRPRDLFPMPDPAERLPDAQGAQIGLEGHLMMLLEPVAHPAGLQGPGPQVAVLQPDQRVGSRSRPARVSASPGRPLSSPWALQTLQGR